VIVDTGPLVAAANRADPRSGDCQKVLREADGPLIVPALVVAEAGFLIERDLGTTAEARFLRSLTHPRFRVEQLGTSDLRRMADLVEQYADLPLGTTDASVVTLAERLNDFSVATLDRRHFTVVRPRHADALVLLP
jgi:uncharacterized protein